MKWFLSQERQDGYHIMQSPEEKQWQSNVCVECDMTKKVYMWSVASVNTGISQHVWQFLHGQSKLIGNGDATSVEACLLQKQIYIHCTASRVKNKKFTYGGHMFCHNNCHNNTIAMWLKRIQKSLSLCYFNQNLKGSFKSLKFKILINIIVVDSNHAYVLSRQSSLIISSNHTNIGYGLNDL